MTDLTPRQPPFRTLRWPDVVHTLQAILRRAAFDEPLYIVGGAVRDAFLQRPVKDLDLATPGNAARIARKLANILDGDVYIMDAERDVARVLWATEAGQLTIDLAHFRGDDLLADLTGRDFTINAMAVPLLGDLNEIIDPLGGGGDAQQKVVRQCNDRSLSDDPLRVLRAVRQSVQLTFRIEPDTMQAMRRNAPRVLETSAERVRDEFMAMLALDKPARAMRVLEAIGGLDPILPEVTALRDLPLPPPHAFEAWKHTIETVMQLRRMLDTISYRRTDSTAANFDMGMLAMQFDRYRARLNDHLAQVWPTDRTHETALILGALLHDVGRPDDKADTGVIAAPRAGTIAERLRLSNPEKKILTRMIAHYEQAMTLDASSPLALHRYWYPLQEHGIDALFLGLADYLATVGHLLDQDGWLVQVERGVLLLHAYFDQHEIIVSPPMPLDGNDLMRELALEPGAIIGDLLTHIREALVTQTIMSRADALTLASEYLQNR